MARSDLDSLWPSTVELTVGDCVVRSTSDFHGGTQKRRGSRADGGVARAENRSFVSPSHSSPQPRKVGSRLGFLEA